MAQDNARDIVQSRYLSAGANRYAWAADWGDDGIVAFGSDTNVCLWNPSNSAGISHILSGHTAHVRAVRFVPKADGDQFSYLITGSDDKSLRVWAINSRDAGASCVQTVQEHTEPINCIAVLRVPGFGNGLGSRSIVATGAADATVKIWTLDPTTGQLALLQTIRTVKRYMPLAVAFYPLNKQGTEVILAVAGTTNVVHIYTSSTVDGDAPVTEFTLQATLPGHENWIRSLDFIREKKEAGSDLLLASASQDKYIRLWRIHQGSPLSALSSTGLDLSVDSLMPGQKLHKVTAGSTKYCIMFEALLLGHEDWIYTARWSRSPSSNKLQLLSASADNTLAIWEADPDSGIWLTIARMGEVSREKGATTATGSIGGFWTGLWSPSGTTVITLGRTGSWRRWDYDPNEDTWKQHFAVSGHTRAVTGISWSPDGVYLLSASSDQTTRLHAEWTRGGEGSDNSWHEMARPQIHGYDLNCIGTLSNTSFVSGADEKLMRVFTEPKAVAQMLARLTDASPEAANAAPDAANIPVLGLSNKAVEVVDDSADPTAPLPAQDTVIDPSNPLTSREDAFDPATTIRASALAISHPPFEESLSRHTLWPEIEKLYGHGYELSCLATSHDGGVIASACKASSLNHAVIRLFETKTWTEVKPPLAAHSLTVTKVRFSYPDDRLLLSVGRDRQWVVFERESDEEANGAKKYKYKQIQANAKGHSRMILDCAWAPVVRLGEDGNETRLFATAGRDRSVKLWIRRAGEGEFVQAAAIPQEHPVTALDFVPEFTEDGLILLAVGTEAGRLLVVSLKVVSGEEGKGDVEIVSTLNVPAKLCLPKAVMQLAWRPRRERQKGRELAIAGEDGSLRIYRFGL